MHNAGPKTACRWVALWILAAALGAQAQGAGLTKKLMEFDAAQPTREDYRESDLAPNLIDETIQRAWLQASGQALAPMRAWLAGANRIGAGMTARNVEIAFGHPAPVLVQPGADPRSGSLIVTIANNRIDFTSSHPASRGKGMDPRVELVFDLAFTVELEVVASSPYVRAGETTLAVGRVVVLPRNELAAIAYSSERPAAQDVPPLDEWLRAALRAANLPLAAAFSQQLRTQADALALPPSETFNGGAVEASRIVIAAFRVKPVKEADLVVWASWKKALGDLMNDCAPLAVGAHWVSGPRPYAGGDPPRQSAPAFGAYARTETGESHACMSIVRVPAGAPIQITWAPKIEVAPGAASALHPGYAVKATPLDFTNPVRTQDSRIHRLTLIQSADAADGVQVGAGEMRSAGVRTDPSTSPESKVSSGR